MKVYLESKFSASVTWIAVLVMVTALAPAQTGLELEETVFTNATVFADGALVENCDVVYAGSRIKRIAPKAKRQEGARVIDAQGRFILPALIDAGGALTLQEVGARTPRRGHFIIEDSYDHFDRDDIDDALAAGVGYVYLRDPVVSGIGGQGSLLRLHDDKTSSTDEIFVAGGRALHARVGAAGGPVVRALEIARLRRDLEGAKKYGESWDRYRKDLEKYEKELAEYAKKAGDKKKPGNDAVKASDAAPAPASGPPQPARRGPRGRRPPRDFTEFFGVSLPAPDPGPFLPLPENESVEPLVGLAAVEALIEGAQHGRLDGQLTAPLAEPSLRRRSTLVADGLAPHVVPAETARPHLDFSALQIPTCAHCGGVVEGAYGDHRHAIGFDSDEFLFEDEKKDDEASKNGAKPGAKPDAGGAPKKPMQPRFDAHSEAVLMALQGKLTVRIEVHRATDIVQVLDLLDDLPMDLVLEGCTEGWRVAERIAKSGCAVVLRPWPIDPVSERSSPHGRFPRGFPQGAVFPIPRGRAAGGGATNWPAEGRGNDANAAILSAAGVPVAFGSLSASNSSASLLTAAAWAAGQGLSREDALAAVTSRAADVAKQARVGRLEKGGQASFVVLDGDPFNATTRVERVYLDGKRVFGKN